MKKAIPCFLVLAAMLWTASPGLAQGAPAQGVVLPQVTELEGDPVHTLLPPDGIPSIDRPEMVPASEAKFMKKNEMVIGVVHNGIAKAYSLWHLDRHEIVNDIFGDDPLAVTW